MTATTRQRSAYADYIDLIRENHNFRNLWIGQIVSLLGDWFNLIASAALITQLTDSGLAVGGLFVVRMLAPFLISPIAGVVADRYNRKYILMITDLARAVVVLGFLLVDRGERLWLLYALTAIQLALSGFFFPARNAILPDIVEPEQLGAANAISSTTWSTMLAFGAAIGGIVTGMVGTDPSFIIDAITFLGSAYFIARVVYTPTHTGDSDNSVRGALTNYVDGLRYLRQHTDIFVISTQKAANALIVSSMFTILQVKLTEEVFVYGKDGSTGMGLIFAAVGIGTGIGPIAARYFTGDRDRALKWGIAASYLITALGLAVIAPLSSFGLLLFGTVLRGLGVGIGWVFTTQLLLQNVPNQVRGRIFATEFALHSLAYSIGAGGGGWLLEQSGDNLSPILWGMTVVILLPGALWVWWIRRENQQKLDTDLHR
ncbi:MAG: MFS transporter [Anaerolineae bacterium]|nr:MFS transporter [Anaerolineae bacterium]